jgi:hypothetical protein
VPLNRNAADALPAIGWRRRQDAGRPDVGDGAALDATQQHLGIGGAAQQHSVTGPPISLQFQYRALARGAIPVDGGQFPASRSSSGDSAFCQGGGVIPNMVCKRARLSRELRGRRVGGIVPQLQSERSVRPQASRCGLRGPRRSRGQNRTSSFRRMPPDGRDHRRARKVPVRSPYSPTACRPPRRRSARPRSARRPGRRRCAVRCARARHAIVVSIRREPQKAKWVSETRD